MSVFLYKFHILDIDNAKLGEFRGGSLNNETWNEMIADEVNNQVIKLIIDNKEFSSGKHRFFMDVNRNIMVPVSMLRDVLNCSAHLYEENQLLVEKHNLSATLLLDETNAVSTGEMVSVVSPLTKVDGEYYASLNDLSNLLGYGYSFDYENNTLIASDTAENKKSLPASYDLRDRGRVSAIRNQGAYGTCWAFGALSAMESALLPEDFYLFSVDHMSMSNSFHMTQYDGGEYTMGMAYLAAWQGPVNEKDDPYGDGKTNNDLSAVKHVQEMRVIASKDISAIKDAVFKYGGVQTSFYNGLSNVYASSPYYNSETNAYCYIAHYP